MASILDISQDTTAFPWTKRTTYAGLPALVAVAVPLGIGLAVGHESAGAIAAGAAYTVGFGVFHEALNSRLLSMGMLTLGIASATLAGSLGAAWTPVVMILVAIAGINYGLLTGVSAIAGWMAQQCAIYVIVASYFPKGLHYAVGRTAMVLAGGALQMICYTVVHFVERRAPVVSAKALTERVQWRLGQLWDKLRGECRWKGGSVGYTVRTVVTLLMCTEAYRHWNLRNGYWLPMTALLVLRPQWNSTLSRGIARTVGTLMGAALALVLARFVPLETAVIVALVLVSAWGCYALQAVNYAMFSMFTTMYIVFLFRVGGFSQTSAAHIRLMNTALGAAAALVVDAGAKWVRTSREKAKVVAGVKESVGTV
jgi:MFS family permease